MNDSMHDPRRDPRHDPRHDPNFEPRPDSGRDPRAFDARVPDPRVPDSRSQVSQSPEPFAADPRAYRSPGSTPSYEPQHRQPAPAMIPEQRSPLAYSQELRNQELRNQEVRMPDPRIPDSRLNDLGQRLQRFGSAPPQHSQPRSVAEAVSPYPGAPLPVGPSSANYAAGEFDRPIPRDSAQTEAAPRSPEFAAQPFGIPPTAPRQMSPSASSQSAYPFMSQPTPPAMSQSNPPAAEPVHAASPAASSAASSASVSSAAPEQPLLAASTEESAAKGGFQRVAQAVRAAIPFVQKLLPLLDGNIATTVSALIASQPVAPAPVQQVHVDLEPVERGMTELRTSHRELRTQVAEQGTTLKRVEDQLERVREATDRNTLEQQELVEDVRAVGTRVSRFVVIGILLLAISVALNVYLLVQLQHIFR